MAHDSGMNRKAEERAMNRMTDKRVTDSDVRREIS